MGRCILCGKSAGLFYSLHKTCYQNFQNSSEPLVSLLQEHLGTESAATLAVKLNRTSEQFGFIAEAQQRTLVRAIEKFAHQEFEHKQQIVCSSSAWLELLDHLSLDDSLFIKPNFIAQQRLLPTIESLHAGELPNCNCETAEFPDTLELNEQLWWRFTNTRVDCLQPKQERLQWSVFMHVLQSALPRKRKAPLQRKELGQGTLWLTNQRLYFETEQENASIMHSEVYALTPEHDGVTVQSKQLNSVPKTFHNPQGILLYHLMRHAQAASR